MLPSLSALRAFDAAARVGSFRAAAEHLSVTPTAISHHIRGLEDFLGTRLFERSGRSVVLTYEGKRLAETTGQSFGMLTETVQYLRRSARRGVRVAAGPIFTARWLMPKISDFWETFPGIELEVVPTWDPGRRDKTEADLIIHWGRMADAAMRDSKILELAPVAIASPDFLDKHGPLEAPGQLLDLPLLHQRDHWGWLDWFTAMQVHPKKPLRGPVFEDANALIRGAAEGQGVIVGWLPLIDPDLKDGRVIRLFGEQIEPTHAYFAHVAAGQRQRGDTQRVLEWLLSHT